MGLGGRQSTEDGVRIGLFGRVRIYYALPSKPADTCKGPVILGERLELYTVPRVHDDKVRGDSLRRLIQTESIRCCSFLAVKINSSSCNEGVRGSAGEGGHG